MAEVFSVQDATEHILNDKQAYLEGMSTLENKKYYGNASVSSESDSELDEEDERDPQLTQQPAHL